MSPGPHNPRKPPRPPLPIQAPKPEAVAAALFAPPCAAFRQSLETLVAAVPKVLGLRAKHRQELPYAVRDLSRLLTSERSDLQHDYLQSPRSVAAYLSYFLPWNVLRLVRLLAGISNAWPAFGAQATLVDLGAGPLTLPLALWIARPDLRTVPLDILCIDRTKKPMTLGRELFQSLAASHGHERPVWRIECLHRPLDMGLDAIRGRVEAISLANVLNELRWAREIPLDEQVAELAARLFDKLAPSGRLLSVEPGTRWGGKLVELVRKAGLENPSAPRYALTPCTHDADCPLLEEKRRRSWCHFIAETISAPPALEKLAAEAKLEKDSLSVSFVALAAVKPVRQCAARVVSGPIRIPGQSGAARYGCSEHGLLLLVGDGGRGLRSGDVIGYALPDKPKSDSKSGALIVELN